MAEPIFTLREWLAAGEQLDQRGFSRTVHADQSNPVALLDDEIHTAENLLGTVRLRHSVEFCDYTAAGLWLRKRKVDCLLFFRQFDALDFFPVL